DDLVTEAYADRWDVNAAAVQHEVDVGDKLAGSRAAGGKASAVNDVVQALLEIFEQDLATLALATLCFCHQVGELLLQQAVQALDLLLLTQLDRVLARLVAAGIARLFARHAR